jgi:hypothetical protein
MANGLVLSQPTRRPGLCEHTMAEHDSDTCRPPLQESDRARLRRYIRSAESGQRGKRHAEQAGVGGCVRVVSVSPRPDRGARGRSWILQTICEGRSDSGPRRIDQSCLREWPARRPLVDGLRGSLRVVSRRFPRRRGHGKRCTHAAFERLRRALIHARGPYAQQPARPLLLGVNISIPRSLVVDEA